MRKIENAPTPMGVSITCLTVLALMTRCAAIAPARAQAANAQGSLEAMFHQAQEASRESNYAQAEKLYRQILAKDSTLLPARVNLGLACYWQHKDAEAVRELQEALRANPHEFSVRLFLGLSYLDLGEYDRAQGELQQAARINDMDPLLFWSLGSLAMIHDDPNAAIPFLERSIALDPNNARVVWLLGQAYARFAYQHGDKPLVPADYEALTRNALNWIEARQPHSALEHVFQGDLLSTRKLTADALIEYRKAQKIDPEWPDIHLMIGSLLGLLGRWDEALAELGLQMKAYPDDTRAMVEMGSVHCRAGDYRTAVAILERALTRDRNNYEASYRLGQAYTNLGEFALAVPRLEQAARLDPKKSDPYYLLYRAYRALKEPEKSALALQEFNRVKAANPSP